MFIAKPAVHGGQDGSCPAKHCHPERSGSVRFANRTTQSKDPAVGGDTSGPTNFSS